MSASQRECGECQVCCELPLVPELKKPMWTRCEHQCARGCAAYATRPATCSAFQCSWHRGDALLAEGDRPDRLGLMLETCVSTTPSGVEIPYVHAWETRRGALAEDPTGRAMSLIERVSQVHAVKLRPYAAPAVYYPQGPAARPDLVERARELRRRAAASGGVHRAEANDPCPCGSGHPYGVCHGRVPS